MGDELLQALRLARDELEIFQAGNYFDEEAQEIAFINHSKNCLDSLEEMIKSLSPQPTEFSLDDLPF